MKSLLLVKIIILIGYRLLFWHIFILKLATCPDNWLLHKSHCYYIHNTTSQYDQIENLCREKYLSYPAIIDDIEKEILVNSMLNYDQIAWIGLQAESNQFKWYEDKAPYNYTNWPKNGSDLLNASSCVATKKSNDHSNSWYIQNCSYNLPFLCQRGRKWICCISLEW